jgi:hypothetical protein
VHIKTDNGSVVRVDGPRLGPSRYAEQEGDGLQRNSESPSQASPLAEDVVRMSMDSIDSPMEAHGAATSPVTSPQVSGGRGFRDVAPPEMNLEWSTPIKASNKLVGQEETQDEDYEVNTHQVSHVKRVCTSL